MSRITTIVLAALLLGALLAYLFLSSADPAPPHLPSRFLEFAPDDVVSVDLKSHAGALHLERDGKEAARWRLRIGDALVRADSLQVEELLNDLSRLQPQNRLPDAEITPEERSRWGLDAPTVEVTLNLRGGGGARTIHAGFANRTLDENHVWARRAGDASAWVIPVAGPQAVERLRPEVLRERRPAGFSSSDVQSVRIERPGHPSFAVERASRADWSVTEPYRGYAEPAAFETALGRIVGVEVVSFIEDGAVDRDRFGLLEPRATLTVRRQGREAPLTLLFGSAAPDGNIYFMEEGEPAVYACAAAEAAAVVDFAPLAFRDTNLLRIGYASLETVEAIFPGSHWRLLRVMERWDLDLPERVPAERSEVDDILERLRALEAVRFLDGVDPAAHSLRSADEAKGRIVITALDDGYSRTLLVGTPGEDGLVPVRSLPGPGVPEPGVLALVDPAFVTAMRRDWLGIRDREVLKVDLGEIRGLARRTSEGEEVYRKRGSAWEGNGNAEWEPDADALSVVQALLLNVRCRAWVAKASAGFAKWGLDDPPSTGSITLILEKPAVGGGAPTEVRRTLLIGDPAEDGEGRFARMEGGDVVFILPDIVSGGGELRPFLRRLLEPWRKRK